MRKPVALALSATLLFNLGILAMMGWEPMLWLYVVVVWGAEIVGLRSPGG